MYCYMTEPLHTDFKRTERGTFAPGTPPGPGRPKQKTMKEYAREWFLNLTDEEKTAYILALEEKRPGFAWTMSEGNPTEDRNISIKVPVPILGGATKAITQGVTDAVLDAGLDDAHDEDTSGVV